MSELDRIIPPEILGDRFHAAIFRLARDAGLRTALEIGSSSGAGSTDAFVRGMRQNSNRPILFCMEVSVPRFTALAQRYAADSFVRCYNVSSVSLEKFPTEEELAAFYRSVPTQLNNYPLERVLGWLRQDIQYVKESGVPADGIARIKRENGLDRFDMVLIDGSEFTGRAELEEVYGSGIIMLDDVRGYKNHHNYQRLRGDANYRLIEEDMQLRNGYAIFGNASWMGTRNLGAQTQEPASADVQLHGRTPTGGFIVSFGGPK